MFDGLKFDKDHPYTAREGRRLIRLMGDELQALEPLHRLGVDPKGDRRGSITGRGNDPVWDYLPLRAARKAKNHTDFPHLTMDMGSKGAAACVTVPNGVKGGVRSKLRNLGYEGFQDVVLEIENNTRSVTQRCAGARPMIYATQRHYPSQGARPEVDARLDVDLRTLVDRESEAIKYQPQWLLGLYNVLCNKQSNVQFGIEMHFSYDSPEVRSEQVLDLFTDSWLAMKPLLDLIISVR